jgi:hypothetical protein
MGLDSLYENDEEYKRSLNSILIRNGVCKTMKEINYTLNKNIDEARRKGTTVYEEARKNNPNYLKAVENKKIKDKEEEERKKHKSKFHNGKY